MKNIRIFYLKNCHVLVVKFSVYLNRRVFVIKDANTVTTFKYCLNRHRRLSPKYYNAGCRIGQILHARLRMGYSSLSSHLYSKNIVPSPSCACGEFESCYHFFLHCPRYANVRNTYLSGYLHTRSVQELLHGKVTTTDEDNETTGSLGEPLKHLKTFNLLEIL